MLKADSPGDFGAFQWWSHGGGAKVMVFDPKHTNCLDKEIRSYLILGYCRRFRPNLKNTSVLIFCDDYISACRFWPSFWESCLFLQVILWFDCSLRIYRQPLNQQHLGKKKHNRSDLGEIQARRNFLIYYIPIYTHILAYCHTPQALLLSPSSYFIYLSGGDSRVSEAWL